MVEAIIQFDYCYGFGRARFMSPLPADTAGVGRRMLAAPVSRLAALRHAHDRVRSACERRVGLRRARDRKAHSFHRRDAAMPVPIAARCARCSPSCARSDGDVRSVSYARRLRRSVGFHRQCGARTRQRHAARCVPRTHARRISRRFARFRPRCAGSRGRRRRALPDRRCGHGVRQAARAVAAPRRVPRAVPRAGGLRARLLRLLFLLLLFLLHLEHRPAALLLAAAAFEVRASPSWTACRRPTACSRR